jgi:hypothetical protein
MCFFALKKEGIETPFGILEQRARWNRDGMGFAFAQNGELILKKGFFDMDDFMQAIKQVPNESPAMFHLRMATQGEVNEANCHPFLIDRNHSLVHFGGFSCRGEGGRSDTRRFCEDFLRPLFKKSDKEWLRPDNEVDYLMDKMLQGRAAIMDNQGRIRTYHTGQWKNGLLTSGC